MNEDAKGILVFCQWVDGKTAPVSRQLLGKGRSLAEKRKIPLIAAYIGYQIEKKIREAACYGAEKIYVIDHPALETYRATPYAEAFEQIIRFVRPEIVLVGATEVGRDLAARTAVRMGTGLTADCTMLDIQEESGLLLQIRPAYGGRVTATVICSERRPQMATVREGVFPVPKTEKMKLCGEVKNLSALFSEKDWGICVKEIKHLQHECEEADLGKAEIVVAGGRGVKDEKGMELIEQLAEALGGTAAASRGAVEDGLANAGRQIGQTGHTIRPKLYIACGISGAAQHLAGIECAERILAINSDAEAPIMQMADYALCADVHEAIPELIRIAEEIKNLPNG